MKTLKQIREDYNSKFEHLVAPSVITLDEARKGSLMGAEIPSMKDMPMMLMFKRISYRVYPNKQVVALYYSAMVDKYLSIPFGPKGNLNLSEATILDELDEDWQDVNRKDKTDGLSQKAVNAYRREHPGSKLKTAVTEKNPTGKRASRRKSFCSRMGGMKKRLTSAKTANDPDSNINKALRRWNCEEEFRSKLNTLREDQQNEWVAPLIAGAAEVGASIAGSAAGTALGAAAKKYGGTVLKKGKDFISKLRGKKEKSWTDAMRTSGKKTPPKRGGSAAADAAGAAAGAAAGSSGGGGEGGASSGSSRVTPVSSTHLRSTEGGKAWTSWDRRSGTDAARQAKERVARSREMGIRENKMTDLRKMIKENVDAKDILINGKTITLNSNMAKRILEVYDSVNTKNKKIVESMLNEDLESFKKLLNFSIRN